MRRITFNEVMLESVKKRSSIKMKDIFKLIVNETYEGGERRLDGKFAFPASRLVTPNGHPNVSVYATAQRVTRGPSRTGPYCLRPRGGGTGHRVQSDARTGAG